MAKLPGLVNYSDDEDQSSSSAEEDNSHQEQQQQKQQQQPQSSSTPSPHIQQQPTTPLKGVLPQPVKSNTDIHGNNGESMSRKQVEPIPPSIKSATPSLPASSSPAAIPADRSTRLNTILRPKPIPGVENWGVPPEPSTECDPDRLAKIQHYLSLRRSGHSLNDHLQRNKAFRNPRIYAKLVEFVDLNETGSNFSPDEFDPTAFPPSSYIDGILETQQKLAEEKAQQRQQGRSQIAFTAPPPPVDASAKFAAAMANAAKIANKIAKPTPPDHHNTGKRSSGNRKWDQHDDDRKRHHHH